MVLNLNKEHQILERAVREAGALVLERVARGQVRVWLKGDSEPVTDVDLSVNALLLKHLANSKHGWLSEESADTTARLTKTKVWVVDPIDGTRALLNGKSDFAISVALVEEGRPVLGVVFAPVRDEFYSARLGHGAFLNGQSIHVSKRKRLSGAHVQADRDYLTSRRWTTPWPALTISKYQSFALRLAAVAAGICDLAISAKPKSEWDVAAGHLLVEEAGGVCCGAAGESLKYNRSVPRFEKIIGATSALKDPVLVQLKKRRP